MNRKVCTMILHEPRVDEYFLPFLVVLSTNLVVLFTNHLLFYYSSSKTSEDPHEFIVKLQHYLLDELEDSKDNPGHTLHGEKYDDDLFIPMKTFWDQFTGEITHKTACASCEMIVELKEPIDYLLLKFPKEDHNEDCTVESLIKHLLQEERLEGRECSCSEKRTSGIRNSTITNFPSFMCILLCRNISDDKITIPSAVEFPAFGFDINGDGMHYDLSATVHYKEKKDGNGHYTAISRSQDWQSRRWFMYDDDRVSLSNFTNTNTTVKKSYMKTAAILFYVSTSIIETRIKNANTIDLMKGGKEQGSGDGNDKMDGEEVEEESGEVESSSGKGFSSPGILGPNVDPQEPVHFPPDISGDGRQHLLPRRPRPALTRTQQRHDYLLLRQLESERAEQRGEEGAEGSSSESTYSSSSGSSSDSSDSS